MDDDINSNDPFRQQIHTGQKRKRKKKTKKSELDEDTSFMSRDVNIMDTVFFPDGLEHIMLAVYFVSIPYVVGTLFIFFYIGKGDYNIFLSLSDDNSFLITWAIGYEVVAVILLLWIAKMALSATFSMSSSSSQNNFKIP
ncbi:hypothetical protein MNB_SV-6-922 [hydrothermal vent metagenome]|uniref:Uncharacterized protein n=1 Tax=hydrothermal vent metagenome TaxID=652676 RepID=A0A1W1B8T7_9ZZZZ